MVEGKRSLRSPRVIVTVTQEHIDTAIPRNSGHCMISDAVKAALVDAGVDARAISTDLQTIRWTDPARQRRYVYLTPRLGQVALVKFDMGLPISPFTFQLRAGQSVPAGRGKERAAIVGHAQNGSVPYIRGGRTPPKAALADGSTVRGARRAYGLRGLELGKEFGNTRG